MKRIGLIICAVLMSACFAACSAKIVERPVDEVMTQVRAKAELPEMGEIKKESINAYMDLVPEDMVEMAYIVSGSGITADEIFIAKAKDSAGVSKIKAAAEKRKSTQLEQFESYNPEEVPKIQQAHVGSVGNYVIFVVSNDTSEVKSEFEKALTKGAK